MPTPRRNLSFETPIDTGKIRVEIFDRRGQFTSLDVSLLLEFFADIANSVKGRAEATEEEKPPIESMYIDEN